MNGLPENLKKELLKFRQQLQEKGAGVPADKSKESKPRAKPSKPRAPSSKKNAADSQKQTVLHQPQVTTTARQTITFSEAAASAINRQKKTLVTQSVAARPVVNDGIPLSFRLKVHSTHMLLNI